MKISFCNFYYPQSTISCFPISIKIIELSSLGHHSHKRLKYFPRIWHNFRRGRHKAVTCSVSVSSSEFIRIRQSNSKLTIRPISTATSGRIWGEKHQDKPKFITPDNTEITAHRSLCKLAQTCNWCHKLHVIDYRRPWRLPSGQRDCRAPHRCDPKERESSGQLNGRTNISSVLVQYFRCIRSLIWFLFRRKRTLLHMCHCRRRHWILGHRSAKIQPSSYWDPLPSRSNPGEIESFAKVDNRCDNTRNHRD